MELLAHAGVELSGARAVVVGRSQLVGKPLAQLLLAANATVTHCHSRTRDLADECRRADVIVAAAGQRDLITADMVGQGAVVIDVGTNRTEEGTLTGDVDFEAVSQVAGAITPVPGGVGPDDPGHAAGEHAESGPPGGVGSAIVDLRRLRVGEWLMAGAGVAPVRGAVPGLVPAGRSRAAGATGVSAWEAFSVTDILLALLAVAALVTLPLVARAGTAVAGNRLRGADPAGGHRRGGHLRRAAGRRARIRDEPPPRGVAGLVVALGLCASCLIAMRDERPEHARAA